MTVRSGSADCQGRTAVSAVTEPWMGVDVVLLNGKRLLVTGVQTRSSIAYVAARLAQEQGAEIVLTGFGRGMAITRQLAADFSPECDVLELDVTRPDQLEDVAANLRERWGAVD